MGGIMCQCALWLCKSIPCSSLKHTNALNEADSGSPGPAFFPKQWGQGVCIFHRAHSIICGTSRAPGLFFPSGDFSLRSKNTWWETNAILIISALEKGLRGPFPGGKDAYSICFPQGTFGCIVPMLLKRPRKRPAEPWRCCLAPFFA